MFLSDADVTVRGLSNQDEPPPAKVDVRGRFMDVGPTTISTTFRPVNKTPEFDLAVEIENAPLTTLNQMFRSYGNFDVVAGSFAFYSELSAHRGRLRGYIKPLFTNLQVYDSEQDRNKPALNKVYESVVGAVARILENSHDNVATDAEVSGRIDDPNVSTWQVAFGLIRNAFFKAVVPGFERKEHVRSPSP